jgi:murein DD-endopeptidase MepM/ murein hydrolase activator NlpD
LLRRIELLLNLRLAYMTSKPFTHYWKDYPRFHPVVPFDQNTDQWSGLDLSDENADLTQEVYSNLPLFCAWIDQQLAKSGTRYLVGGYGELRKIYASSAHFDGTGQEPRRLHLGVDIWGPAGTPIYAPCPSRVHSVAFNEAKGDYGGTVILSHFDDQERLVGHTLYGHLSKASVAVHKKGDFLQSGEVLGWLGDASENGGWPPHLHFQIITDMEDLEGDYPGVCRYSERERYLGNCPNPELILRWSGSGRR